MLSVSNEQGIEIHLGLAGCSAAAMTGGVPTVVEIPGDLRHLAPDGREARACRPDRTRTARLASVRVKPNRIERCPSAPVLAVVPPRRQARYARYARRKAC
jgi:hypothetical protein